MMDEMQGDVTIMLDEDAGQVLLVITGAEEEWRVGMAPDQAAALATALIRAAADLDWPLDQEVTTDGEEA